MEITINDIRIIVSSCGLFFLAISLWALRETVLALLREGRITWVFFKNRKNITFQMFWRAILSSRLTNSNSYRKNMVIEDAKALGQSDNIYDNQLLAGMQATCWGILSANTAFIAFIFKCLEFIIGIIDRSFL